MNRIELTKVNEAFFRIGCEPGILRQISDFYRYEVPGAKFSPSYKRGRWDGFIRLLKPGGLLYSGLYEDLKDFVTRKIKNLELIDDPRIDVRTEVSPEHLNRFVESLGLPSDRRPYDYQLAALARCIRRNRCLSLMPTGSGKSLTIYMLARYHVGKTTLVIVPNTSLIHQIASDFVSYGCDPTVIQKIYAGQDRNTWGEIIICTWQTLIKLDKKWFNEIDVVICDEAHLAAAKSLVSIISEALAHVPYRFGFTGTLDGSTFTEKTLTGLFGPVKKHISTAQLMEEKRVTKLKVKTIVLSYSGEECEFIGDEEKGYQDELDFLMAHERRTKFIVKLTLSLKGNTMVVCDRIEKHLDVIFEMLQTQAAQGRKVIYISGAIDGEERDRLRKVIEAESDCIVCASRKSFATGTNIKNLFNIVFASPLKAQVANLQAIGRGLRLANDKEFCTLYDIADDLRTVTSVNSTYRHYLARKKTYKAEKFDIKEIKLEL